MFSNEAFARTAERYMDTIYRVAYGWLKNPDDANDVTQDVLIELYKTEKAFESDAHLKNWLIRATVNRCKMLFRSPWRRLENIDDYTEMLGFEHERDQELFKSVMSLDKKYRVPLLLFYYEGYSTAEVASMLRIPVTMHNVSLDALFRPHAWASFGTDDTQAADYAACRQYGPLYR